ncbi:MAG: 4Fe-4S dicluster domain-containing protein [Caldimicrobium sp.]|nr:4Fe-4S dicluster domain-containing protein [Caldimicrobium sp.]MDW8094224.1 4Fe-4S dicluster domain-containing protein [Caldimicrobium sp.]
MIIDRRKFLKISSLSLINFIVHNTNVWAEKDRYIKFHDVTKCIGCKRCMSACKRWNKLKLDRNEDLTDRETDLTGNTWVVVNLIRDQRNVENLFYIHWACQHCEKPACMGACPVSAIKQYLTGAVVIDENKCIGCRYCYQSCPYKIPRFDFEKRVSRKCTLCYDRIPRLKPACVEACPVSALDFGLRNEILSKVKPLLEKKDYYLLGEIEAGGTNFLTLLPSPPQNFGLVVAPPKTVNESFDKLRISSYGILTGLSFFIVFYLYSKVFKHDQN